jgi:hypothetical protein
VLNATLLILLLDVATYKYVLSKNKVPAFTVSEVLLAGVTCRITTLAAELPRRSETDIVLVDGVPVGSFNIIILSIATALFVVANSDVFLALSVILI